jgi:large-conductance mechanosensitive channel
VPLRRFDDGIPGSNILGLAVAVVVGTTFTAEEEP